jgi:hypothetical protein
MGRLDRVSPRRDPTEARQESTARVRRARLAERPVFPAGNKVGSRLLRPAERAQIGGTRRKKVEQAPDRLLGGRRRELSGGKLSKLLMRF